MTRVFPLLCALGTLMTAMRVLFPIAMVARRWHQRHKWEAYV